MRTVLITAIGGDIGQAIAVIVKEVFPDVSLIGIDIHDQHAGALYVDKCLVAPRATAEGYLTWLDSLIRDHQVDTCIPISDAELVRIAARRADEVQEVRLVMPSASAISVGGDKLETAAFLKSIGCPGPWTRPANAPDGVIFPCIFKPRRGAGSKCVFVCRSRQDVELFSNYCPDAVLQELLSPPDREITCAVYRTLDGRIGVLQLLRRLVGGLTGWAEVISDPDVTRQCEMVARGLDLRGAINIQLRLTEAGPRIFEINPRFSSTVLMRHKMGFQDVVWAIREANGMAVELRCPPAGMRAVRTQGASLL